MVKKYKCTRCGKMFIPVAYKYNDKLLALALKKNITLLELCSNCEDILTALWEEDLEYDFK